MQSTASIVLANAAARDFVRHLRLPFQAALAPFFLLGSALAGIKPGAEWAFVFVLVHVGLYGGATVYNSYFDKDQGPVGMLKRPPPVTLAMFEASLVLQLVAVAVLAWSSWQAGIIAAMMMAMSCAYSHPKIRLKRRALFGLLVVSIGQGALSVFLGFFAAGGALLTPHGARVALAASAIVVGVYPLTQVYQLDEDAQRGDQTLALRLGWRATLIFSGVVGALGLAWLMREIRDSLPIDWTFAATSAALLLAVFLAFWGRRFAGQSTYRNHDWAMAASVGVSLPISLFLLYKLLFDAGLK